MLVIRLTELKAKPDAKPANTHAQVSLVVSNLQPAPRPRSPFADLVTNPTPPGKISRERLSAIGACPYRDSDQQLHGRCCKPSSERKPARKESNPFCRFLVFCQIPLKAYKHWRLFDAHFSGSGKIDPLLGTFFVRICQEFRQFLTALNWTLFSNVLQHPVNPSINVRFFAVAREDSNSRGFSFSLYPKAYSVQSNVCAIAHN